MQRKNTHSIVALGIGLCLLISCNGRHGQTGSSMPWDSLCSPERAMQMYAKEPHHALLLIDSIEAAGVEPAFTCDYMRATVYSRSFLQEYDSAIALCTALLAHDSLRGDIPECATRRANTLSLLCNCYRMQRDYEPWLRYATELVELNRSTGEEVEALRTEAEIGFILSQLGRMEEGLALLDKVIDALDEPGSVNRFDACIVAIKRKINVLEDRHEPPSGIIPLAQRILEKTAHFRQHTADYADDSYRLPASANQFESYCAFCDAQAYGFLAKAYAAMDDKDAARYWLVRFDETPYGRSFGGRRMVVPARLTLGQYDEVSAVCDMEQSRLGTDTFNDNFTATLRWRALVAEGQHQPQAACDLWRRYAYLDRALTDSLRVSTAHTYAARFHAQEQQRLLEQQQASLRADRLYMAGGALVCLLIIAFALWQVRQRREMDAKNRVLAQQIAENVRLKSQAEQPSEESKESIQLPDIESLKQLSNNQLFELICHDIRDNRLFCDPKCDRQMLTQRYGLTAAQIGAAFAQGSEYNSVADFLRECRLEFACSLLTDTDAKVSEVAAQAGFSRITTFNHDFKAQYSLAPSEYRKQNKSS